MRVASSIPIAAAAAMIFAAAIAGMASDLVRAPPPPPQPATVVTTGYKVTEIARGLDHPWSMAFLPVGSMLVTERVGRLRLIKDGVLLPRRSPASRWCIPAAKQACSTSFCIRNSHRTISFT